MRKERPKWTEAQKKIIRRGKLDRTLLAVKQCGQTGFLATHTPCGCRVWIPSRCKSPLCPSCARIWSAEQVDRYAPTVAKWKYPRFITLTGGARVKAEELPAAVQKIKKAFMRLRASSDWGGKQGFWRVEIAYNRKKDSYHVHIHALTDWRFVHFARLAIRWTKLTGAKHEPDVKKIYSPTDAVREALKYVLKFAALPEKAQRAIAAATVASRSFSVFGKLRVPRAKKKVCLCPRCGGRFAYDACWKLQYVEKSQVTGHPETLEVWDASAWRDRLLFNYGESRDGPDDFIAAP